MPFGGGGGGGLRDVMERYDTCTELVVIYRTDMTAQRYVEELTVPFALFVGSLFKLMHDNAQLDSAAAERSE